MQQGGRQIPPRPHHHSLPHPKAFAADALNRICRPEYDVKDISNGPNSVCRTFSRSGGSQSFWKCVP